MESLTISLVQADLKWEDIDANLLHFDQLLKEIPDNSEIVILPEMFSTGFTMQVDKFKKPVGRKSFHWLQQKAKSLQKVLVGSVLTEQNGKYFNRMVWMRPDGTYEYYDKKHLFQMGGEHKVMTAGNRQVVVTHKGKRFMLQICYDLRFPCFVRNAYQKGNYKYDAIIYIANWPQVRKQAYMSLLKARAVENQCFVIWVNRVGVDGKGVAHSGDTQIVDATGKTQVIAEKEEQILTHTLDFSALNQFRNRFQVGLDWDK